MLAERIPKMEIAQKLQGSVAVNMARWKMIQVEMNNSWGKI